MADSAVDGAKATVDRGVDVTKGASDSVISGGVGKGFGAGLKAAKAARDATMSAAAAAGSAASAAADMTGVTAVAERTGISSGLAEGMTMAKGAKTAVADKTGLSDGLGAGLSGVTSRLTESVTAVTDLASGGISSVRCTPRPRPLQLPRPPTAETSLSCCGGRLRSWQRTASPQ